MKLNGTLIKSAIVAALGGLVFGFDTVVISGTTDTLTHKFALSALLKGVTVASALLGTVFGAMLAGIPGEKYGRRDSLRITGVLYLVSALGCALAWDWSSLVFFRFVGGLGIGASSVLGPMYIAEIAPARLRGRLVGMFQFNIVLGVLLAYFSNYMIVRQQLGDLEWRLEFGVATIPALLFFLLLFTIPRSPRWLVKQGRVEDARSVLQMVGEENYDQELQEIVESIRVEQEQTGERLFSARHRLPIFLAVSIGIFNQLTGINAILYYLPDIFMRAGFSKISSNLQSVAIGATNLVFTVFAMSLIDKIGRKILLLIGAAGTATCLAGVAAIFYTSQHEDWLVLFLVAFIAFFAFSQGAVIWVYLGEVFPNAVRAKGQSLGSLSHWVMNTIISLTFPLMAASSGAYPFMFFAVMTAVQFFVVLFVYPETKGVTLEAMQKKMGIS